MARAQGGKFHLRIEDIDQSRARVHWEAQIYEDLGWLGLEWSTPVLRQSQRMDAYSRALGILWDEGLLYACTCNRRDIAQAASAPQEGASASVGPDGIVYPGTCRNKGLGMAQGALRLDMSKAAARITPDDMQFNEQGKVIRFDADALVQDIGDVVLARRNMGTSYHLSVVMDDSHQEITCVTRGLDLADATPIHVVLQHLLGLAHPTYHHHKLIRDDAGIRLAKRDDARAIALYRQEGTTPGQLRGMVGL